MMFGNETIESLLHDIVQMVDVEKVKPDDRKAAQRKLARLRTQLALEALKYRDMPDAVDAITELGRVLDEGKP